MTSSSHQFEPQEFLRLADLLARKSAITEAEARTAVSRAYYAVRLYARERLINSGWMTSTSTGRDHQLVIETLKRLGGPEGDEIDWLRIRRTRADYQLGRLITGLDAVQAVAVAQTLFLSLPSS